MSSGTASRTRLISNPPEVCASESPIRTASGTDGAKSVKAACVCALCRVPPGHEARVGEFEYATHERHGGGIEDEAHAGGARHLAGVAEQTETGHVGRGARAGRRASRPRRRR